MTERSICIDQCGEHEHNYSILFVLNTFQVLKNIAIKILIFLQLTY